MATDHVFVRLEAQGFSCRDAQVHELKGRERISRLYEFEALIVVVEPGEFDPDAALGDRIDIVFERAGAEVRRVHGMVSRVQDALDSEPGHRTYRLSIRPRAHRLSLVETQDIFVGATLPEVIQQKLKTVGIDGPDVEYRLTGKYPELELVVQYKESELAFLSRRTEHVGISFVLEQKDGRDVLVFTDHGGGFGEVQGAAVVPFHARGDKTEVFALERVRGLMPSWWVVQDYNYRTPHLDLTNSHDYDGGFAGGVIEYGTHHRTPDAGGAIARMRAEERAAQTSYFEGASDRCEFTAGAVFKLEDHPRLSSSPSLLLVEVEHEIVQVVASFGGREPARYKNRFRAVDATTTFRPPRVTPRPRIAGLISGIICGDAGGTGYGSIANLDDRGRYRVRLDFDTEPLQPGVPRSHTIRMIQQHAGPGYGTHLPLKPGVEVAIAFVDGDPDRPMIVGALHNEASTDPVWNANPLSHVTKTASGILVEARDAFAKRDG